MSKTISSEDFYQVEKTQELAIIDVREIDEYASGHIPSAKNLPLSSLESTYSQLNKDIPYYVICHSGRRSELACRFLADKGYNVTNVLGGMISWRGEVV